MQTQQDADHRSAGGADASGSEGVLEGSVRVSHIYRLGTSSSLAKLYDADVTELTEPIVRNGEEKEIVWRRWRSRRLVWSHTQALLFLQGMSLHDLLKPYCLLAFELRAPVDPEPGLDNVVIAELVACPPDLGYEDVFRVLVPCARG